MKIAIDERGEYIKISLRMLNRHGVICGTTGSGKTVTLKYLTEKLSELGVPTLVSDIKGDLSGFITPGYADEKLRTHCTEIGVPLPKPKSYPVHLYDVYGNEGQKLTTSISNFGPTLLANVLELNENQEDLLSIIFHIADDYRFPFLTLNDLRKTLKYCYENNKELSSEYGAINKLTVGAIQRKVFNLKISGGEYFFTGSEFNYLDLFKFNEKGGVINLLDCSELIKNEKLYSCVLIWLLSELYEGLEEIGDLDRPAIVLFFDESHLIFSNASKSLLKKIEQMVRLSRSKGIGVIFCTQAPTDLPDEVLGQLGLRIQHALRAFTQKAFSQVRLISKTMRNNPELRIVEEVQNLAVGEALISSLDKRGVPTKTKKAFILPPSSKIGVANMDDYQLLRNLALKKNDRELVSEEEYSFSENNNTKEYTEYEVASVTETNGSAWLDTTFNAQASRPFQQNSFFSRLTGFVFNGTIEILYLLLKIFFFFLLVGAAIHIFPPALFFIVYYYFFRRK